MRAPSGEVSGRVRGALLWSAIEIVLRQAGQLVMAIVLARLVAPAEFGLLASLALFTTLAALVAEGGLGMALIQRTGLTREDESTVFWFNLAAGAAAALALAAAAPWIARFYGEPRLVGLTRAMAANLWLSCWLTVHVALLTKKLDFRTQVKASAGAALVGGAAGIAFALRGAGAWALAIQALASTAANVVMIWRLSAWRPAFVFRAGSLRRLYSFGGFLVLASLLDALASRIHTVLIGRLYSARDLGMYARALGIRDFPQEILASMLSRVAFPLFSEQATDPAQLARGLQIVLQSTMALALPLMCGLALAAPALVPALFGDAWAASIPILRVLCVAGALWPVHAANLNALMALGHSKLFFRLELVKKGLLVLLLVLASPWGLLAIAWAAVAASLVALFLNTRYTGRLLGYPLAAQLRDLVPAGALTGAMALVVGAAGAALEGFPALARLGAQALAGAAFYFALGWSLRLPGLTHLLQSALPTRKGDQAAAATR